jgi:hypothetical protein
MLHLSLEIKKLGRIFYQLLDSYYLMEETITLVTNTVGAGHIESYMVLGMPTNKPTEERQIHSQPKCKTLQFRKVKKCAQIACWKAFNCRSL